MVIILYVIEHPITEEIPSQCGQKQFCEYWVLSHSFWTKAPLKSFSIYLTYNSLGNPLWQNWMGEMMDFYLYATEDPITEKSHHSVVITSSVSIESQLLNKGPSKKFLNLSYIQLARQPAFSGLDGEMMVVFGLCNWGSNHWGNLFTVLAETVLWVLNHSFWTKAPVKSFSILLTYI
jgi:hypothetical protein